MTKKHLFSRLLKKAVSMALWTKASLCVKSSLLEQSLPRTPSRPKTSDISVAKNLCNLWLLFRAFLWLKNPFNQRNLRLIKDLRVYKMLYNCRGHSTNVVDSLQIRLFMQNKANFRKVKLNVNNVLTMNYDKKDTWWSGKTKPIQSQSKPIKANSKPIQTQFKPN